MSTLPPECEQFLISGYVLGDLSPGEALLFAEMLAENPSLKERVIEMQEALDLAYGPPEVPPPPSLRDRILAAANKEISTPTVEQSPAKITSKTVSWNKIFGAIALATITTLGIANYRLWQSVQTVKNTNIKNTNIQNEQLTYFLGSQDPNQESKAELIVTPKELSAILTVNQLPSLPPDKAYALWTVVGKDAPYTTDEKGAILTAVFQVNKLGSFTQEIAVPQPYLESKTIKKVAITIEDISVPQAHQGEIFISSGN